MDDSERERLKQWVETWKRAGPELERIRREELRAFRYEDKAGIIESLLEIGVDFGRPRLTSGLVEQQRLFMKGRK
jgi:hypothetical protein